MLLVELAAGVLLAGAVAGVLLPSELLLEPLSLLLLLESELLVSLLFVISLAGLPSEPEAGAAGFLPLE